MVVSHMHAHPPCNVIPQVYTTTWLFHWEHKLLPLSTPPLPWGRRRNRLALPTCRRRPHAARAPNTSIAALTQTLLDKHASFARPGPR
eukprot:scaffold299041_cov31-Tisochrysis_lutea.AAC.3